MSTCPACGDAFRKGRKALILLPTGELSPRVVCGPCATTVAVRIVPVSKASAGETERRPFPEYRDNLHALKRKLVAYREREAHPFAAPHEEARAACDGRIQGLDQAIALVDCLLDGRPL